MSAPHGRRAAKRKVLLTNNPRVVLGRDTKKTLRHPGVAHRLQERLALTPNRGGFPPDVSPDLVVDAHLPSERAVQHKFGRPLATGTRTVGVAGRRRGALSRYAAADTRRTWSDAAAVIGEPIAPFFACRLCDSAAKV